VTIDILGLNDLRNPRMMDSPTDDAEPINTMEKIANGKLIYTICGELVINMRRLIEVIAIREMVGGTGE
jgi:hypothetical protein